MTSLMRWAALLSAFLGALSVLAELCFRFPHHLVSNDARAFYVAHLDFFRALLLVTIVTTFLLGCAAVVVLGSHRFAIAGLAFGTVALLLGGPDAQAWTAEARPVSAGRLLHPLASMFGTAYRPGRWPQSYGVVSGRPPAGYFRQLAFPFSGGKPTTAA